MRECDSCGAPVTERFVRVFGDNAGRLRGCHQCATTSEFLPGGTRRRELDAID